MDIYQDLFDSDAEREECHKTHSLLESIYKQSRCRQTLCEFVPELIYEVLARTLTSCKGKDDISIHTFFFLSASL